MPTPPASSVFTSLESLFSGLNVGPLDYCYSGPLFYAHTRRPANLKGPAKQVIHSVDGHPSAVDFTTVTSTASAVRGPVEKEGEGYLD